MAKAKTDSQGSTGRRSRRAAASGLPHAAAGLAPIKWEELEPEQRQSFLDNTWIEYKRLVDELFEASNSCVDRFQQYSRLHVWWRWAIIICTGVIALLNAAGAVDKVAAKWPWIHLGTSLFAVAVTILATLEGFTNAADRAQGYRESREMFVDVGREFAAAWRTYVHPLNQSPEACANAAELYRRLIAVDSEVRSKFKEMTTSAPGKSSRDSGGPE